MIRHLLFRMTHEGGFFWLCTTTVLGPKLEAMAVVCLAVPAKARRVFCRLIVLALHLNCFAVLIVQHRESLYIKLGW